MRVFTGGNGLDTTSAVVSYLATSRELFLADLYLIGELEDTTALFFTNWNSPLSWPLWGTFLPEVIKRGTITSQIGLKVDSLDLTWSPRNVAYGSSFATANPYQLAQSGFYDNKKVRLWRCVMPTAGDANTYGATPWFGGYISDTTIERGAIKWSVQSFLNVVNQEVPPNVIELSNTFAGFAGNVPVLSDSETSVPSFTVVAPSSTDVILGDCIQPTAHKIYGKNKFFEGFLTFAAGSSLAGYWSPVALNQQYNQGGGVHYNQFQTYAPFPWAPTPGDVFYVSTQWPVNMQDALAGQYFGFPYVPAPTSGI